MPNSRRPVLKTSVAWLKAYRSPPWLLINHEPDDLKHFPGQTFRDPDAMGRWIKHQNQDEKNIYVSVNPAVRDMAKKPKKAEILHAEYLHVDLDNSKTLKLNGVPPPTFVNDSGNGLHLFWKLRKPSTDFKLVEATNRALAEALGATPETANVDRVLRVPWTRNFPNAKKKREGKVECECKAIEHNNYRYDLEGDFGSLIKRPESAKHKSSA